MSEDWNEMGDWLKECSGESKIEPYGQLLLNGTQNPPYYNPERRNNTIAGFPDQYTITYRVVVHRYYTTGPFGFGFGHQYQNWDINHNIIVRIYWNRTEVFQGNSYPNVTAGYFYKINVTTMPNKWYIFTVLVDTTYDNGANASGKIHVYRDGNFLAEVTDIYDQWWFDGHIRVGTWKGEVHMDYLRIATGWHPPISSMWKWWHIPIPFHVLILLLIVLFRRSLIGV